MRRGKQKVFFITDCSEKTYKSRRNSENLPQTAAMPFDALHIFIAFDDADIETAEGLYRYLNQAFDGAQLEFWNPANTAPENYRAAAGQYLEKTHLFIACLSPTLQDTPDMRWVLEKAVAEQKRRKNLQVLVVLARAAFVPDLLSGFPLTPAALEPVEGFTLSREIQVQRAVQTARDVLFQFDRSQQPAPEPVAPEFVLTFEDVRERLLVWLEQCDLSPLFLFLKQLLHPEKTPDAVFQLEDAFAEWRQQAQRNKLTFDVFSQTVAAIRLDLRHLIEMLEEHQFRPAWPGLFANTYYALAPVATPADQLGGLFLPVGAIQIPETLNLPGQARDQEIWEGVGTLTVQQQQEFRRNLLLAQDALGIGNFAKAHNHCEHVRAHIDPQSAQLYELLLITYLKKETPDRIVYDAVYHQAAKLNHVIVYAGRFAEYLRDGKCPSEAGRYNLQATAEALANALLRLFSTFQNDYILHTGRYSKEVPDNRAAVSRCVQVAMEIYRTIHPYRGFLELAVNEMCNGGKYDYIRQLEIIGDEYRFASHEDFGLESEIREVIGMLEAVSPDDDDVLMNRQLRENLFFNLKAKRTRLQAQIAEERRRYLEFTDLRDSVIELVHAALLGFKIFGDQGYPDTESFLRLAIEQVLPGLLIPTASGSAPQAVGDLRWFDLDEQGAVCTHPDCARFRFDAFGLVEKIARDHAGHTGWLQVHPNIKQEVFRQFVADTDREYRRIHDNLQWTDIRRMNEYEARRSIIGCLRRWQIAYRAYPETGAEYLQRMLHELIGSRLMVWMHFETTGLVTVPESRWLGYDAVQVFRQVLDLPHGLQQEDVYKMLAHNLFHRHIKPVYDKMPKGDEQNRPELVSLLLEALHNYRDLHPAAEYLDFVFDELTKEIKFRWVDITGNGEGIRWNFNSPLPFDPPDLLEQLALILPERYRLLEARRRIANNRNADLKARYFREISEFSHENRQVERQIAIEVIRKLKGVFLYYPDATFLELPLRELEGHGRIRWQENFLGIFPSRENHYENRYYRFDYRQELSEFRMYRDTRQQWMEHVLRQTGDLPT